MVDLAVAGEGPRTGGLGGEGLGSAPRRSLSPLAALSAALTAEGDRRILWVPVFFGTGIAVYFTLTIEPPLWLGIALVSTAVAVALGLRRWPALCIAGCMLAVVAAGFTVMQASRLERGTAMLERRIGSVALTGRVVDIDQLASGWRVVIAPDPLPGIAADAQPKKLRVRIPATSDALRPGDRISVKARLYPAPAQVVPGGWDLQRALYFLEIGGVGYSFDPARRIGSAADRDGGWREWLLRLRNDMTNRINAALPGSTGGIAAALITGKRGAIAEEVNQAFRDSGLAHLLAISGMNLALVGGFVFVAVRGGLALIPWVALRYPIKKIAAVFAIIVMFFYLMISGASIPTERSFIMNGIVFAAVLIDRLRLSMRLCALAALVLLALEPESLVGVSFQMSFGAVIALIAVYEKWGAQFGKLFHSGSLPRQALGYGGAVLVTTLIATAGTDPFAIYHFHRIVLYSPLANLIAVPLSGVWIMPWGLVACLLMPFGLEQFGLTPMGWGIDATIWVAQWVAAMPGNVWSTPRLPLSGMVMIVLGGCWLCLWQGRWRLWGTLGIAAGLATMLFTRPPDLILGDFGRLLAARAPDGNYFVADTAEKLSRSFLAQETGATLLPWPAVGAAAIAGQGILECTAAGRCLYSAHGKRVALVTGEAGLPVVCNTVDAIVAQLPAGSQCRFQIPVVDRIDSWRQGAIALWLDEGGIVIESANESRGDRPWVPHPVSARERAKAAETHPKER
jgi:competence protein ComEC